MKLSERVMELFLRYPWKGNIRELSNVIERGVLTAEEDTIEVANLPESFFLVDNMKVSHCPVMTQKLSYEEAMAAYEKDIVQEAYERCKSSRKMANYLQISQSKANRLIQKYIDKNK